MLVLYLAFLASGSGAGDSQEGGSVQKSGQSSGTTAKTRLRHLLAATKHKFSKEEASGIKRETQLIADALINDGHGGKIECAASQMVRDGASPDSHLLPQPVGTVDLHDPIAQQFRDVGDTLNDEMGHQHRHHHKRKGSKRGVGGLAVGASFEEVHSSSTSGRRGIPGSASFVDLAPFYTNRPEDIPGGPLTVHVAATHYDAKRNPHVVQLGINGLFPNGLPSKVSHEIDADANLCWCDEGMFLNIRGLPHRITSVMHNGVSLCMGDCAIQQTFFRNWNAPNQQRSGRSQHANTYVVQIAELPNAPIKVLVNGIRDGWDGIESVSVSLQKGDLGRVVPAWICIAGGLQVFIGAGPDQWRVGCIEDIKTSKEAVHVDRNDEPVTPSVGAVSVGDQTFYLPRIPPDQTQELTAEVMRLLTGGDAVITTCGSDE